MKTFDFTQSINELSVWAYLALRNEYWSSVMHVMENFLNGNITLSEAKKTFKRSLRYAYTNSAKEAWVDGGGELPVSQEVKDYVKDYIQEQYAYLDEMFAKMRVLKASGNYIDVQKLATEKADLWSRSLDIVYNNVKAINAGNIMLQFTGEDGEESCTDCLKYKGKWHTARWWYENNAVPPNRDFECGGWKCQHYLADRSGKIYTI